MFLYYWCSFVLWCYRTNTFYYKTNTHTSILVFDGDGIRHHVTSRDHINRLSNGLVQFGNQSINQSISQQIVKRLPINWWDHYTFRWLSDSNQPTTIEPTDRVVDGRLMINNSPNWQSDVRLIMSTTMADRYYLSISVANIDGSLNDLLISGRQRCVWSREDHDPLSLLCVGCF